MQTRDRRRLSQGVQSLLRDTVDFLYPPACAACHRPLADACETPRFLCTDCRSQLAPIILDRCERCSAPVGPYLDTTAGCIHCRDDRFAFERVFSLGVYDARLRSAVLSAKQQVGDLLTASLAELLARREVDQLQALKIDLIVPVPHHWTDRLVRRHLTPATMAARLSRRLKAPWTPHILAKVRRTRPQTELNATERRNNLRGAFRLVGRPQLEGTRILLVDDVLTTGTTAHRAAAVLKKAGATVFVAVIARGLGPGSQPAADRPLGAIHP